MQHLKELLIFLRAQPGFRYVARNRITIHMDSDESCLKFYKSKYGMVSSDQIEEAIHEALNIN